MPHSTGTGQDGPAGAYGLTVVADLAEHDAYTVPIQATFPFDQAAEAHRISGTGHVAGKLILTGWNHT